jgi:hypothetical protein
MKFQRTPYRTKLTFAREAIRDRFWGDGLIAHLLWVAQSICQANHWRTVPLRTVPLRTVCQRMAHRGNAARQR